MNFVAQFLAEAAQVAARIDHAAVANLVDLLADTRDGGGRLFVLGVGGSAGNASHAVNDFRKISGFEAYAPTDNVSELTARINDDGWDTTFVNWLKVSRLGPLDCVLVFSVGGGDLLRKVSINLVRALEHAKTVGARIGAIVGRDGGFTATVANACVIIPTVSPERVTAHAEAFQAVVWHMLVAHPRLQAAPMRWESLTR
ncbi:MAG TPA: SIS domain-containing protein [Methylomirabilota bacterium]|nr:SIS domain-containing protein [Methylomirabilota bacterium]